MKLKSAKRSLSIPIKRTKTYDIESDRELIEQCGQALYDDDDGDDDEWLD